MMNYLMNIRKKKRRFMNQNINLIKAKKNYVLFLQELMILIKLKKVF